MTDVAAPAPEVGPTAQAEARADQIMEAITKAKGGNRREAQFEMARHVANCIVSQRPLMVEGGTGVGKALDLDTPIPTPRGFVRMGDLKVGDEVYDEMGRTTRVTHVHPVRHNRDCFEVTFSDGSTIIADGEHLWDTLFRSSGNDWASTQTVSTVEIARSTTRRNRHHIPLAAAIEGTSSRLPVQPYALGLWLGGSSRHAQARVLIDSAPESLHGFIAREEGRYRVFSAKQTTLERLNEMGVMETRHIPDAYLFASKSQRKSLLAGLLDAGAFVVSSQRNKGGQVQFTTAREDLARDAHALVCSLGHRATLRPRERDGKVVVWIVAFTPAAQVFQADSKAAQLGQPEGARRGATRSIVSVTKVESRPVRCITVDSPRHLYLAGRSFIPTHNSLAYLAGVLAARKRTVIAPHTIALQQQMKGDLEFLSSDEVMGPLVEQGVLTKPFTYADLQGKSNYACKNRLEADEDEPSEGQSTLLGLDSAQPTSDRGKEMVRLIEWAKGSETGNKGDLPFQVSQQAWATISAEECAGKACPYGEDCFAALARQRARHADIVVTNQSLLSLAMLIPNILPDIEAVVVDEAHEFGAVVGKTFGAEISVPKMERAIEKAEAQRKDTPILGMLAARTRESVELLVEAVPRLKELQDRKALEDEGLINALDVVRNNFTAMMHAAADIPATDEQEVAKREVFQSMMGNLAEGLQTIIDGSSDTQVAWVEMKGRGKNAKPIFHSARFDVSEVVYEKLIKPIRSVVFTSATLTVMNDFDLPAKNFGMREWDGKNKCPFVARVVESPFDYQEQGLVWLPPNMPQPSTSPDKARAYLGAVAEVAKDAIQAAEGRTLILCTSRASVQSIGEALKRDLGKKYPVLIQEPGVSIRLLAQEFAADSRAVLVGTRTFWAGVSVEGPTCSVVVIDKVPFPSPADPIIAARSEKADRRKRGSSFKEVSLAEASLTLVQGAGRLVRTVYDKGVVVCCDPRVNPASEHSKFYGSILLNALPDFARATDRDQALDFMREINRVAEEQEAQGRKSVVELEEEAE